jgi:hypothetical protein
MADTAEERQLAAHEKAWADWKKWGPYLSERAWGTVREDYSADGSAWEYFPHDHARMRAYRWNEDGLAGICDSRQQLCFALALWNGQDPILKERLFGLANSQGNHGEDIKELYFYLDNTPTHSYMKALYKYPQAAYPYGQLVAENARRSKGDPEYELLDTGVFDEDRYFDVFVEYAKAGPEDVLIRITAANRGPARAVLHLLPTLWYRNTWSWDRAAARPTLREATPGQSSRETGETAFRVVWASHSDLGDYFLYCEGASELLFTENETNFQRLYGTHNLTPHTKDAFHAYVIGGDRGSVNPHGRGTKAAAHYVVNVDGGQMTTVILRLASTLQADPFGDFDAIFAGREQEADEYYAALQPPNLSEDERRVHRQALAGLLWSKQFYHYDVDRWLRGDPGQPPPTPGRYDGRNHEWVHFNTADIVSVPDKWEFPWFAAWDLAFHCVALARIDPEYAKAQLVLMGREWYQHPNGQMPAYEWAFGDVNPPLQAWATWRVYTIQRERHGVSDLGFLERMFHKLLMNFIWWVNRKDLEGRNIFQGGFLGLDNIGVFDRGAPLPDGSHLEQSDGTAWMGMFCLNMLTIALELALHDRAYEDMATKFFEHFLYITAAMNDIAGEGIALWNDQDEFFYDVLHCGRGETRQIPLRSMVGLIPLFAVTTIEPAVLRALPEFKRHMEWFLEHRPHLARLVSRWQEPGLGERRLLAILRGHRMKRVLRRMLDETEFLSPYGVRALSRGYADQPYVFEMGGARHVVQYWPAESQGELFGGNSNWRGPVWFPVNYLIIEALQQFHHYYGDDFHVECPTGSRQYLTLRQIADELSQRLARIFLRDEEGRRPVFGGQEKFQRDPYWRDNILFHEYFHGDNGSGVGASHQTGWTALVAELIQQQGEARTTRTS